MKSTENNAVLDQLVGSLGDCLTPESAKRVLELKAGPALQARVDELAHRHAEGTLTADEEAVYGKYVSFSTFVAILKSKARQLLAHSSGD